MGGPNRYTLTANSLPSRPLDLQLVDRADRGVVGEVEMRRRDRHVAAGPCGAVGAVDGNETGIVTTDPIVFAAARIEVLDDGVAVAPLALPGDHVAAQLGGRQSWHVDVEQRVARHAA